MFGELGFDVTENFTITAGGRWFDYDRKFALHQEAAGRVQRVHARLDGNADISEDGTVVKLNLTYRFDDDRMVYATYRRASASAAATR